MRRVAWMALWTVLAALAAVPGTGEDCRECGDDVAARWERSGASVSLPLSGIVGRLLRAAGVPDLVVPDLVLEWTLTDTLIARADCQCPLEPRPCCSGSNARAFALLNLFQDVSLPTEYFGVTVPPQGNRISALIASGSNWRPTVGSGGTNLCHWPRAVELTVRNYTGSLGLRVGVDQPFDVHRVSVSLNARATCQCNPYAGCAEAHPPMLTTDPVFVVPEGEARQFLVRISDRRSDVRGVAVSDTEAGAMVEGLVYDYDTEGKRIIVGAKVRIPYHLDRVVVHAMDECGQTATVEVPVVSIHRPKIAAYTGSWQQLRRGRWVYTVDADVTDRDFYAACVRRTFTEWLRLSAKSSAGGEFRFAHPLNAADLEVLCGDIFELEGRYGIRTKLEYSPSGGAIPRDVTLSLTATDAWGFSEMWTTQLLNGTPQLWRYESSPPASSPIRVPFGSRVQLSLSFSDPDGDWIELRQVRGPGTFGGTVQGQGSVEGTLSWTARSWQRHWLVEFECQDYVSRGGPPYEGPARAMFLFQVVQPPRANNGYVTVHRNRTATTSLYVYDPDTPPGGLTFSFQAPRGLSARVITVEEPPPWYGSYYGYTARVEVTADRTVCPGAYPVPFTVTDPDGNSGHATLTVHVRGNRPPQASPPHLRVETTVTLTPGGVEAHAVNIGPIALVDPEGDAITRVGLSEGPVWGSAGVYLSGSKLSLLYRPAVEQGDLCRAVRDRDVIVDEFTVILSDACGAVEEVYNSNWSQGASQVVACGKESVCYIRTDVTGGGRC